MSEEKNVVDARYRFRGGAESQEQRRQARADGAVALEALKEHKGHKRLPREDREQIARRIGFRIHTDKVDRPLLAKRAGYEPKELYRLVIRYGDLKYGEKAADKYRLRAAGEGYAAVIATLAGLLRTNVADLVDRITRGTSIHPSDSGTSSDAGAILNLLYSLVDGIDEEFYLTKKFRAISRVKVALPERDPWALWPARLGEDDWKERDRLGEEPWEERLQSSFWIARTEEEKERAIKGLKFRGMLAGQHPTEEEIEQKLIDPTFGFENWHWDQAIGYLPHFFLGHQRDFAWDGDFWPPPAELNEQGKDDAWWMAHLAEEVFEVLGRNTRISTSWGGNGQFLFNGELIEAHRKRLYLFQVRNGVDNAPYNWEEQEVDDADITEISPTDPPAFFWLCLYPNADATGVVPVLFSTDWNHGAGNTIELLDERMLSNIDHYPVLGGETLGARLRRALLVSRENQEPILKAKLRRTAHFVERHPLWRKHQEYEATARHIKKWREQVLKGGPYRSGRQEEES